VATVWFFIFIGTKGKKMDKKFVLKIMLVAGFISLMGVSTVSPVQTVLSFLTSYPNPFDSRIDRTNILYTLDAESEVKVKIYDLFGNIVREYEASHQYPGIERIVWDGTDNSGRKVAKGGYICVIEINNESVRYLATRKIGVIH
jgi:flagellar hook assembly protein FlgD